MTTPGSGTHRHSGIRDRDRGAGVGRRTRAGARPCATRIERRTTMKRIAQCLAAAALVLGAAAPAPAQWLNRNQVLHSANGAYNSIAIANRAGPRFPGPAP